MKNVKVRETKGETRKEKKEDAFPFLNPFLNPFLKVHFLLPSVQILMVHKSGFYAAVVLITQPKNQESKIKM